MPLRKSLLMDKILISTVIRAQGRKYWGRICFGSFVKDWFPIGMIPNWIYDAPESILRFSIDNFTFAAHPGLDRLAGILVVVFVFSYFHLGFHRWMPWVLFYRSKLILAKPFFAETRRIQTVPRVHRSRPHFNSTLNPCHGSSPDDLPYWALSSHQVDNHWGGFLPIVNIYFKKS